MLAGFPYISLLVEQSSVELREDTGSHNKLIRYSLVVSAWTVQDMTGGATSGDQITDQGNIQRALESILDGIPPNGPWQNVPGFLHCIPMEGASMAKDPELYEGFDVYKSTNSWEILVEE